MKHHAFSVGKFHLYNIDRRILIIWRFVLPQKGVLRQSLLAVPAAYQKRAPKAFSIKPGELCPNPGYFPTIF